MSERSESFSELDDKRTFLLGRTKGGSGSSDLASLSHTSHLLPPLPPLLPHLTFREIHCFLPIFTPKISSPLSPTLPCPTTKIHPNLLLINPHTSPKKPSQNKTRTSGQNRATYTIAPFLACSAHSSANSFSSVPTCPLTHTSFACPLSYSSKTSFTSSKFAISPRDFFRHPFAFHPGAHSVNTFIQNSLSVRISHFSPPANRSAAKIACASIRIFVEFSSLPSATGFPPSSTAYPPNPGFGTALPSVQNVLMI